MRDKKYPMIPPGIEPGTLSVLDSRDNRYTMESLLWRKKETMETHSTLKDCDYTYPDQITENAASFEFYLYETDP